MFDSDSRPLPGLLLAGNFLSQSGSNRGACEDLADRLQTAGWPVIRTSSQSGRIVRVCDMVATALYERRHYRVAHVDVFSGPAFLWAEAVCLVLRLTSKPYVLTLHGGYLPAFARRWPGRVQRLFRSASAITTPSRYLLEQMRPYHSDIHLLPNALDLNAYRFSAREQPQPHLLWLRAFHGVYNPLLAPKVVASVATEFPDVRLTMVGPDKGDGSLQHLQQLVAELGVTDRIDLPGAAPKAEVPHWMNKGDIFLNTTNVDNTPVSVIEAMACGLCVVSTNVGGVPYLLEQEQDALLVPPDDPQAMAAAVRRILTEPGLAEHLSCNARKKAETFAWSTILPQWEALLTAVAEGRRL